MEILPNAPTFQYTPTYDGSGQVVHPSVIDFWFEFGLPSWGGYRFWMGITPYPDGDNVYENPSLLVSQDGLLWVFPPGIKNPLDQAQDVLIPQITILILNLSLIRYETV